jgi:large subunit ribosomal protein L10
MALTKAQKQEVIDEVSTLLADSKLTVVAQYQGTSVKQIQELRKSAKEDGSVVKVIKNRLVIKALQANDTYKDADSSQLSSMLLYAFNAQDEVAPAKALHTFAKKNPTIKFVGAFTAEGAFISAADVTALASLPSKHELIASVIATLNSPINDVMSGLSGGIGGILSGLEAKATS